MTSSRPVEGEYNSGNKPVKNSAYQLHNHEILDLLTALGITENELRLVDALYFYYGKDEKGEPVYYGPENYFCPMVFSPYVNKYSREQQDEFTVYQIMYYRHSR